VVKTFGRGGAAPCHPWFFGFWNLAIEMTADYTDGTDIRNTILPYPCDPCHPWFFGFWNLGIEVCLGFGFRVGISHDKLDEDQRTSILWPWTLPAAVNPKEPRLRIARISRIRQMKSICSVNYPCHPRYPWFIML
jgi:hypothetical protein